jgi:hypothetical protein
VLAPLVQLANLRLADTDVLGRDPLGERADEDRALDVLSVLRHE